MGGLWHCFTHIDPFREMQTLTTGPLPDLRGLLTELHRAAELLPEVEIGC